MTIDPVSSMVYINTSDSHLVGLNPANPGDDYEAELIPEGQDDQVVGLQYLADNDSVCVALRSGDILLYDKTAGSVRRELAPFLSSWTWRDFNSNSKFQISISIPSTAIGGAAAFMVPFGFSSCVWEMLILACFRWRGVRISSWSCW